MWEQMKCAMVESTRGVCGSVRMGVKNPQSVWWNDEIKAAVRRKEAVWKELLAANDEESKDVWNLTEKKRERLKVYISEQKESK